MELDLQGNILGANDIFLNLLDVQLKEIEGSNYFELLDQQDSNKSEFDLFWQQLLELESLQSEFSLKTTNQNHIWLTSAYYVVKDLNGNPQKILSFSRDISTTKKIALEHKKLSLVASKTNNAVVITDPEGNVEWVNEGFSKMTGYTFEEVLGRNPGELLDGVETNEDTIVAIRTLIKDGKAGSEDIIGYNKQGQKYWVNVGLTPVFNDQDVLTNFIIIETDITERKKAEEEILLAKKRTEKIYELTSDISGSLHEQVQRVLEYATLELKMNHGIVSEVKGKNYKVYQVYSKENRVSEGVSFDLSDTYCEVTLIHDTILAFASREEAPDKNHPCFKRVNLEAYIGVPVRVDGKIFGTLNFSSSEKAHKKIMQGEKDFVLLLAEWIGAVISRLRHEHKLQIMKEEGEIMNTILNEQNDLLNSKNEQLEGQSAAIEDQYHVIKDSIEYAQRIQNAILPPIKKIQQALPESFVFYQPRDLVSGDMYWFAEKKEQGHDKIIVAVLDCTGHGVPGAFMSMIGNDLLNQVVHDKEIHSPEIILRELHRLIRQVLRQDELDNNDGMDMGILTINKKEKTVDFAGAKHSLMLVQDGEMQIIKGDRMPLGGEQIEKERVFKNYRFSMPEKPCTMRMYMVTDGYQDQFGGEKGRKFMTLRFRELLQSMHHEPMAKQKEILENTLSDWMKHPGPDKHKYDQIDDILVMGICL